VTGFVYVTYALEQDDETGFCTALAHLHPDAWAFGEGETRAKAIADLRVTLDDLMDGAEVTLTPTDASELLGLSRPFVARLLDRGDIPSELLPESRHRRIRLEDVLAFQVRRESRAEGQRRIADVAGTADLPY
jgi:excisionase family DNA binding protein